MRFFVTAVQIFFLVLLGALVPACAQETEGDRWVHKLEVLRRDGIVELGSAVNIAPGRVLTNCHVIRNAARITLVGKDRSWRANPEVGDSYRDLCILDVPGWPGQAPPIATPDDYHVGTEVMAVGYSDGQFARTAGAIKGLFACACDGGQVIQTSANFDPGASGGGLFDAQGRLLGILTFKSATGGDFHFAVPVSWMSHLEQQAYAGGAAEQQPFWASESQDSGHFLAACDLQARQDWSALAELARDWTLQQPSDPQAWMALGRAERALGRRDAARSAFQRVLRLDSVHAEAGWALQELEFQDGSKR